MSTVIAHLVAFFLIGGLGGLIAALIATPVMLLLAGRFSGSGMVTVASYLMGFGSGFLAVYIGVAWFKWMHVDFGYLALAAIYIPLLYNDNRRAQAGADYEKSVLAGTFSSLLIFALLMAGK